MNRRTFMSLMPALSAFPSIAEAVVKSQPVTTTMGLIPYLRDGRESPPSWYGEKIRYEQFEKFMKEVFRYNGPIKMYYLNGEWHER